MKRLVTFGVVVLAVGWMTYVCGSAMLVKAAEPQSAGTEERWFATWTSSRQPPDYTPPFVNRTIREIVHTSIGGDRARIRLSNEHPSQVLVIGSAHIALRATAATTVPESDRSVTFGGHASVRIRPGTTVVSDAVKFDVPALADIVVSLYLPDSTRAPYVQTGGPEQRVYISAPGDFGASTSLPVETTHPVWMFLSGVDVTNGRATGTIVAFGSSITGGARSTPYNHGWPDVLAQRLLTSRTEPPKGVVAATINGNRLLSPGNGPSSLARFDRDVLMQPGVSHIIILEGANDIHRGSADSRELVSAEEIIFGFQQLADRAHERGLVVLGATITPLEGVLPPRIHGPEGEAVRQAVNTWIRTSRVFDGVIDFDVATRDPAHPTRLLPAYDSDDHIHLSDAGYKAMAECIDLSIFRRRR